MPAPNLKCIAWDPNDCDADEAREYTGTPGEIAMQHAEWMHEQGDPQEKYNIRVRTIKESIVREWDVYVYGENSVTFHSALASPVKGREAGRE